MNRLVAALIVGVAVTGMLPHGLGVSAARAQAPAGQVPSPGAQPAAQAPKGRPASAGGAQAAKSKPAEEKSDAARADGSSQLRQRIDQLEEQVNEMHVAVGTLDSLAKSGAARAPSGPVAGGGGFSGDASARLEGLEGRIRSMSAQIDQMAQQIRALEGGRAGRPQDRTEAAPPPPAPPLRQQEQRQPETRQADLPPETPERSLERADAIGGLIRGPGSDRSADVGSAPLPPISSGAPPRQQPASLTTATGNPREIYEKAYGNLLRQDYGAAEIGFAEFLAQFPNHELSGNAQYWLGESFYVRGQYRPAANAFLKGYQSFAKSQKAPDSLLKLGMSLDKLGQREAACSSIGELSTRFPTAPAHIQSRAQSERARLGC